MTHKYPWTEGPRREMREKFLSICLPYRLVSTAVILLPYELPL